MIRKIRHNLDIIKRADNHYFVWNVKNLTNEPFIFKRGIALFDEARKSVHPRFIPLAFTDANSIPPDTEGTVLFDNLVEDKVVNYRFWFHYYPNFGIEGISHIRHWITLKQFKNVSKKLDKLVKEFGWKTDIEEAVFIEMKKRNKELDKIISGQSVDKIINIEFYEGFNNTNEDNKTELGFKK